MTCWGISESSDDGASEFKVLGESYVAPFFYLASKSSEKVMGTGHDFLLPLCAAPHPTIPDPRDRTRGSSVSEASWRSAPSARKAKGKIQVLKIGQGVTCAQGCRKT